MTQAREMTKSEANSPDQQTSDDVTLEDCLREFKQEETLDDDNMWYCNKCKEHVHATKTMELYRLPRVMIITLKRFKQSKSTSRYMSMMGGGT